MTSKSMHGRVGSGRVAKGEPFLAVQPTATSAAKSPTTLFTLQVNDSRNAFVLWKGPGPRGKLFSKICLTFFEKFQIFVYINSNCVFSIDSSVVFSETI